MQQLYAHSLDGQVLLRPVGHAQPVVDPTTGMLGWAATLPGCRSLCAPCPAPLAVHARRNAALPGAHAVTQDSIACWHSAFFSAYTRLGRSPARRGQHQRRCER